jgi:hypothetical protein
MFGTRITKRAAIIVGCTLLAAGTAAAAAGGAIPTPFTHDSGTSRSIVSVDPSNSSATSADDKSASTDSSIDDKSTDTTLTTSPEDAALCATATANTTASTDATSSSVDDKLAHDAKANHKSVDDFCTEVEAEHANGDDNGTDANGSIDDHGNDVSNSVHSNGHGADDTKTSVSTPGAGSTSISVTGTADDHSGSSKGKP